MMSDPDRLKVVDRHEVQYAIVTLSRDKEFIRLMDSELTLLESSLVEKFTPQLVSVQHFLFKDSDKYYVSLKIDIANKSWSLKILVSDTGPAFVIHTSDGQQFSLLSAKRIRETIYDLALDFFDQNLNYSHLKISAGAPSLGL